MRALVFYAFAVTIAAVALALNLNVAHHRIVALEQQLVPARGVVASARTGTSRRSFTAHDGTVLTAEDLDRIDADDARIGKIAAELEYSIAKQPLPNVRARKVNRP